MVLRFACGATLGLLILAAPVLVGTPLSHIDYRSMLLAVGSLASGLSIGYALAMRLLRPWLRAGAVASGRQSVIAGLAAASVTFTLMLGDSLDGTAARVLTPGLVGGFAALAMWFPWLLSRAERRALRELDASPTA